MKFIPFYKDVLSCQNQEEVFSFLISTFKESNRSWNYFVDWPKIFRAKESFEVHLNILNSLIGKQQIEIEARKLLKAYPEIIQSIPILIALRDPEMRVLTGWETGEFEIKNFSLRSKKSYTNQEITDAIEILRETGILQKLQRKNIKSLVDYGIGVEVGLDSNARKNRGGKIMETIVESYVSSLCHKSKNCDYLTQASKVKIKKKWNFEISVEKANRRIDFAIKSPTSLYLIETNFYGGGGSKLKSTAGEYKSDFVRWKNDGAQFIWITDGLGWKTTKNALRETFDKVDYIFNLEMLGKGVLDHVIV